MRKQSTNLFEYSVFVGVFFFIGVILLGTMAGCVHYTGMQEKQLYETVIHVR